jgi:DUF1365 family protein
VADIVQAHVFHARTRPRRNAFRYGVCYLRLPLSEFVRGRRAMFFSVERFNLFSLFSRDYGDGKTPPAQWIARMLARGGVTEADGEVALLTLPRVLGYAFNPISFWLCHDRKARLRCVLAEVRNTFGERHSYLCFHDDHRPIAAGDWLKAEKIFHVSPFLAVEGHYRFRFALQENRVAIWINHYDSDGLMLSTSLIGDAKPLRPAALIGSFLRYPVVTFKVVALIHYQAVKIFLKGIRHYAKPKPPVTDISR